MGLIFPTVFLLAIQFATGANILFYQGVTATYSHQGNMVPILDGLVAAGHNVTIFGPHQFRGKEFVSEFRADHILKLHEDLNAEARFVGLKLRLNNIRFPSFLILHVLNKLQTSLMEDEDIVRWIQGNKFDLVIVDCFGNEIAYAMAHYWNAKVINYHAVINFLAWDRSVYGVPDEYSWLPGFEIWGTEGLSLFDKILSMSLGTLSQLMAELLYLPALTALMESKLKMELPPLKDIMRERTELLFVNWGTWDHFARPLPPFAVSVAGAALYEVQGDVSLPTVKTDGNKDIEGFIGDEEFVYMSFGTVTQTSYMPDDLLEIILKALGQVEAKILLKWDGDVPSSVPGNVLLRKWYPQVDVLRHRNIRAFVTQGGQNSIQQGIYNGVPLIVVPITGDQNIAGKFVVHNGLGRMVDISTVTSEKLKEIITDVLRDGRFRKNSENFQRISQDLQIKPKESALWWIDRVLRNESLSHLKPLSLNQPFWSYRLLDVLAIIFLSFYLSIGVSIYVIVKVIRKFFAKGMSGTSKERLSVKAKAKAKKH